MKQFRKPAVIIDEMQDLIALKGNRICLLGANFCLVIAMVVQLALGLGFLAIADCLFLLLFTCVYVTARSYQSDIFRHYFGPDRKNPDHLDEMLAHRLLEIEYACGLLFLAAVLILPYIELAVWQNPTLTFDCFGLGLIVAIISFYYGFKHGFWARTMKPTPKYCVAVGALGAVCCFLGGLILYIHGKTTSAEFWSQILIGGIIVFIIGVVFSAVTILLYHKRIAQLESEGDEE